MKMKIVFNISLMALAVAGLDCAQAQTLDTTTFVVMGEGLAAGMANFGLSSVVQNQSFPSRMAASMNTGFNQPLIEPPGIGDVVGYPGQEVEMQKYPQGSVRQFYYPTDKTKAPIQTPPLFVLNTSVPGLTLNDSISMRPVAPVVQKNMKQTVFNMLLGFPQLILNNVPLWTQFEYAKSMFPTMALIELGYYEALDAAVSGDPTRMPDPAAFGATYGTVVAGLRGLQAQVIATTIPNPIDTAYFNSVQAASTIVQTVPFVLTAGYHLTPQDYVTRNGLLEISTQFTNGAIGALPAGSTLSAATAADITNRVNALNAQIISVAKTNGAVVYDLNAFMHKVKVSGVSTGTGTVTGDYFGGFYSMDGIYPGGTGHALIANDILSFLNSTYHQNFPPVDVKSIATTDPAIQYLKPTGHLFTASALGISGSQE
ncbi:MAG TPA: hypothetical protein VHZ74_22695 [Bryobacteraceae bacterium]|nr:hypothetical protein [Bryobacteraceae bacterium]